VLWLTHYTTWRYFFLHRRIAQVRWKYKFIISDDGYPYSKDLDDSINRHLLNGYYDENNNFMIITGRGTDEFNTFIKHFPTFIKRERYIDAACSTSILIPYKDTKKALLDDPSLKTGLSTKNQDWISYNNAKLKEITDAIGAPIDELIIPAISWIEYLLKINVDENSNG
jgi:hypothetical protein